MCCMGVKVRKSDKENCKNNADADGESVHNERRGREHDRPVEAVNKIYFHIARKESLVLQRERYYNGERERERE